MNDLLKQRIARLLESLSDERGYQILDYIEFLDSKYAERARPGGLFAKITETVEDTMRAGKLPIQAISGTMGIVDGAAKVMRGLAAAGQAVVDEAVKAAESAGKPAEPAVTAPPGEALDLALLVATTLAGGSAKLLLRPGRRRAGRARRRLRLLARGPRLPGRSPGLLRSGRLPGLVEPVRTLHPAASDAARRARRSSGIRRYTSPPPMGMSTSPGLAMAAAYATADAQSSKYLAPSCRENRSVMSRPVTPGSGSCRAP